VPSNEKLRKKQTNHLLSGCMGSQWGIRTEGVKVYVFHNNIIFQTLHSKCMYFKQQVN